ncbi:hypothetical protein [Flavobacterium sp. ZS1P14]|uniref:hypothetical protein n=1 Tax=Flavobacterium sp. ZS1P14 TaxID=3401729 RepID=UPI003AAECA8A
MGCTSNDVQIQRAYLVDVNGVELPPNFTCQGVTTVRLVLELTTKTPRVGVVIFANVKDFTGNVIGQTILANPKECFGITLNQPTNTVKFTQTFGWTCGAPIVLTNVFIG